MLGLRFADQSVGPLLEVSAFGEVAGKFGGFFVERDGLLGVAHAGQPDIGAPKQPSKVRIAIWAVENMIEVRNRGRFTRWLANAASDLREVNVDANISQESCRISLSGISQIGLIDLAAHSARRRWAPAMSSLNDRSPAKTGCFSPGPEVEADSCVGSGGRCSIEQRLVK